jgi:chromosome partitioning protein
MSEKKVKRIGATKSNIPKSNMKNYERPKSVRIISVCNQKGGCGKTTTVINIAAGLAKLGQRVLVIDLDSQCNATTGLGIDINEIDKSVFELLVEPKKTNLEDVILETQYENLHIAPASIELSEFESRMAGEIGRENRLKKALLPLHSLYDFIILDTPPSLGLLSVNALNAANEVQIALQAHPFAFDGLNLLLETIGLIKEELNPKLQITGSLIK